MKQPNSAAGFASSIDWRAIHGRMEHVARALEQNVAPAGEEKKKILRARARDLARALDAPAQGQERVEIVEFMLAYERYALESKWVREVYPLRDITPLPGTPGFILGIINVRRQIVSVVDLKKFFDLPPRGLTEFNKVIIIANETMEFGLLADAVPGVRSIPRDEIQPPLPTLTGIRAGYLQGITADRLVVLDGAKLLADPVMKICQANET